METNNYPVVSVIIPCRNEEKYIAKVLDNLLIQTYPVNKLEILVVDGLSDDSTAKIVSTYADKYPFIQLLENPAGYVPFALNTGIRKSKGEVIVRMDAHAEYPSDYIEILVKALITEKVDNVGGVWVTEPGDNTKEARAIALATSHAFGIGNAQYRLAGEKPRLTDTVPFGCYHREIFNRIGMFDEQLIRNQDDEFNGRLIKSRGKILLLPAVKISYHSRGTLKKIRRMFYQYGYFKPLVNIKLGKPATVRQLFPPLLVGGLSFTILLGFFSKLFLILFIVAALTYAGMVLFFSLKLGLKQGLVRNLALTFPSIHFAYGTGYLSGILDFIFLRKHLKKGGLKAPSSR